MLREELRDRAPDREDIDSDGAGTDDDVASEGGASGTGAPASVDSSGSAAIFFAEKDDLQRPVRLTPSLFEGRPATVIFDYPEYCGVQRTDARELCGRC